MKTIKSITVIITLIATVLLASCVNEQSPTADTIQVTQNTSQEITGSVSSPRGEIITSTNIINEEGGYYLPVPDSWFNKTSYETNGKDTYIYHITQDENEIEQNPELLHVSVSDDLGDDTGVFVFINIGTRAYYQILQMDFPYMSADSSDGSEYAALNEDIQSILDNAWLLDDSGKPTTFN